MNSNKRYYWLKLKETFFSEPIIKKLRKIAGGDTYTIIYQKILLLSIKTNGEIYFEGIENNFAEELALILDEEPENVQMTLNFMKNSNLIIESGEPDKFILPHMSELIGSETQSTIRSRKSRTYQKQALQCNTNATLMQLNGNKNATPDIELELRDKSYIKEKEKKEKTYIAKEKKEKPILTPEELIKVKDIISFLNNTCFKKFNYDTKETQRLLKPILKQYDVELIKKTIAHKNEQWGGDDKMKPFLRPSTLFNFNHFESYYNELPYEVRNPEL